MQLPQSVIDNISAQNITIQGRILLHTFHGFTIQRAFAQLTTQLYINLFYREEIQHWVCL